MGLDDFEKELALNASKETKESKPHRKRERSRSRERNNTRRSRDHHHHHHRSRDDRDRHSTRRDRSKDRVRDQSRHRHKRSRRSESQDTSRRHATTRAGEVKDDDEEEWIEKEVAPPPGDDTLDKQLEEYETKGRRRDAWMEAPSSLDIDYVHKKAEEPTGPLRAQATQADYSLKIHDKELNTFLKGSADSEVLDPEMDQTSHDEVDYTFGDEGSQWRMTKLKAVYRQAQETERPVDEVALDKFGSLRDFDHAREEEEELDRRKMYGRGYLAKEKPSGDLYQERKSAEASQSRVLASQNADEEAPLPGRAVEEDMVPAGETAQLYQTALNKLKAQMMKAKLRGAPNATELEAQYNAAIAGPPRILTDTSTVTLGAMQNRMLTGGRKGEVKAVTNRRGQERGTVVENEDMSVEDMVRQERRMKNTAQVEGLAFAERIAKDGKFDNDLDYLDENAEKLAKRVVKSELNLRNMAISDFQKMNRILDSCVLCHHEDTNKPPVAPIVSLGTRVYLTLATEPELTEWGTCIVPIQHRINLLDCDDDEWEEIRNFMKCLTRMYHDQGREVIFYENAASPHRRKHAAMMAIPIPYELGQTAPAFFREAILSADEEWSQHKKLIDTLKRSRESMGRVAFRRSIAKEMPYFHVWFELDGGLGHVIEDANRWPTGDLFAREVIGGMVDAAPDVIKRQGKWHQGDRRVEPFRKKWRKFDWTRVLTTD